MNEDEEKFRIIRRLSNARYGLTARDLARDLSIQVTQLNRILLRCQSEGMVKREGQRWVSVATRRLGASQIELQPDRAKGRPTIGSEKRAAQVPSVPRSRGQHNSLTQNIGWSGTVDRESSRWKDFRNLCDYYAECVRLDQRASISVFANQENDFYISIEGTVPYHKNFQVNLQPSWSPFVRRVSATDYFYLGFPIEWHTGHNTKTGESLQFVKPVFIAPLKAKISKGAMHVERLGSIRINDSWLNQRVKRPVDRRRFFSYFAGAGVDDETMGFPELDWREYASILRQFYQDWCRDFIDPANVGAYPLLADLKKNGIYNRAILIVPKSWKFSVSLHSELHKIANVVTDEQLDQTILTSFFPSESVPNENDFNNSEKPEEVGLARATPLALNAEQRIALENAATSRLSLIVGPPGTGKSHVVAAIMGNYSLRDRTVLLASRNHQPIDAVLSRVNSLVEPHEIALRLSRPWQQGACNDLENAVARLISASHLREENSELLLQRLAQTLNEIQSLDEEIERLSRDRLEFFELLKRSQAIAEKNKNIFSSTFSGSVELATATKIQEALANLASIRKPTSLISCIVARIRGKQSGHVAVSLIREIDSKFRGIFDPKGLLPLLPEIVSDADISKLIQVLSYWLPFAEYNELLTRLATLESEFMTTPPLEDLYSRHRFHIEHMLKDCKERLWEKHRLIGASVSTTERKQLTKLHQQLRSKQGWSCPEGDGLETSEKDSAFEIIQQHFPIMAVTNLSAKRNLPLQAGLFDLLVIDEASQCDVASVIPMLFRAQRAVIVGDPMQLPHVTSISHGVDERLRQQFRIDSPELACLNYVDCSLFDLANNSQCLDARIELLQHHRCHPEIADYCSSTFYKGRWIVLTNSSEDPAIRWTDIADDSKQAEGSGATSQGQIDKITEEVMRLELNDFKGSLGIVTPFKQQANELRLNLSAKVSSRFFDKARIVIETADGFQGDERDMILFSLVAGIQLPKGCMQFLENSPNRFNVAVSRARSLIHIFGDAKWAETCHIRHIRELYQAYNRSHLARAEGVSNVRRMDLVGPIWEPKFAAALKQASIPFESQYPIAGRYLDFAILQGNKKINVEIDGEQFHVDEHGYRLEDDIVRDQHLISLGWQVLRFWVFELRDDLPGCLRRVQNALIK